jgi:hypothetical protein
MQRQEQIQPLIDVNRIIMQGLRGTPPAPVSAPPPRA